MIILPAIDLKDGQCVRLYQGDYAQVTTYDTDPVRVAQRWQVAGASWLHIVDLDGAAVGHPVNTDTIARMRDTTSLHIEVGGGLRSLSSIEQLFAVGIDRIILGTIAMKNRALLAEAVHRWGTRIAVGLDARDGWVATLGWRETSQTRATDLAAELGSAGVKRFIYTDIARDGTLGGPNIVALQEMQQVTALTGSALIASGGISSPADLRSLATLGVEGAIIGKAIYTGDVDLATAIQEFD